MRRILPLVAILVVIAVGLIWWLHGRSNHEPTKSTAAQKVGATGHAAKPRVPAKPATVSGHVTRKPDGGAIAGAVVSLAWAELGADFGSSKKPTIIATTDANGSWTAKDVPPGDYLIAATAKGFVPAARDKLVIASGEQRSGIDFTLEAGGTPVRGTVSDVLGGPIVGARLSARRDSFTLTHDAEFVTLTAADGTYELTLPDAEYRLAASHDDYTHDSTRIEVDGKPITADFKLIPGGVIRGQVVARDTGKPVPGALVEVQLGRQMMRSNGSTVVAGEDGQFIARGLSSGNASIEARGRGYASSQPTAVQIGIGEEVDGIQVLVDRAFSISGRVVKQGTKQGIAGARLGAFSMSGGNQAEGIDPSDADGAFEIAGVRPGNYMLFAAAEGSMIEIGKNIEVVDRDVTDVIIELSAGVTLSGRVDPPAVATVTLELEGEVGLTNMFEMVKAAMCRGQSDASGAFTLKNAPPGKFKLHAATKDGTSGTIPLTIAAVDLSGLVIPIKPRASIAGRVIDTNGKPVADIGVAAHSEDDKPRMFSMGDMREGATTAADGTFKVVGLEPGKYEVRARVRDDFAAMIEDADKTKDKTKDKSRASVEVAEGAQKTGVTLTIEARDGVIRGIVIGADHKPAADSWVTARMERDKPKGLPEGMEDRLDWFTATEPVLTNAEGRFTIDKLKKGKYALVADGPRGSSRGEKKGVMTGDSATIQLASLGTLTVTVTQADKPVTKYDVSCDGPAGDVDRHVEAATGEYQLEHLAPGDYKCTVRADAGTSEGKVTVPTGEAKLALKIATWGSLSGVVVSVLTGKPVPGLSVVATGIGDQRGMLEAIAGHAPKTDPTGRFVVERVAAGKGTVMFMPKDGGFTNMESHPYEAKEGQRVDLGTIKIVPPRSGDAGTFGLSTEPDGDALKVTAVKEGGPAALAGVVVGDKITAVAQQSVKTLTPPLAQKLIASGAIGVGETVSIALERGQTVTLTSIKW